MNLKILSLGSSLKTDHSKNLMFYLNDVNPKKIYRNLKIFFKSEHFWWFCHTGFCFQTGNTSFTLVRAVNQLNFHLSKCLLLEVHLISHLISHSVLQKSFKGICMYLSIYLLVLGMLSILLWLINGIIHVLNLENDFVVHFLHQSSCH